jgi:hypothetical protein
MMAVFKLLLELGVQSLLAHRTKSLIVGGLMAFGAFLVVTSLAVLDSVTRATRASLVESIAGDVQIYSKDAEDSLALLGGIGFGSEDIGEIDSYTPVKEAVSKLDNIAGMVPMGIANAAVASPGDLDRTLNALREAVKAGDTENVKLLGERVRTIARVLQEQQSKQAAVAASEQNGAGEVLARALSDDFWAGMDKDPIAGLDWLDTKLAPLGEQGNQFYLRLVGTDLDGFKQTFHRIKIIEGEYVPSGTRGVLVGKAFLDRRLKFAVAMHLDTIHNEIEKGQTIAGTKTLQETLAKAKRASSRLVYMLPPKDLPEVTAKIAAEVGKPAGELGPLLLDFLTLSDVLRRHRVTRAALPVPGGRHHHADVVHQERLSALGQCQGLGHLRHRGPRELRHRERALHHRPDDLPRALWAAHRRARRRARQDEGGERRQGGGA